ncbi:MAG: hypothetical protein HY706_06350, partial [Candidatus Hydrogenedentes bacterium]|nr:hypothetical protein [Candidatus Hydrogenedentota bacterium]
MQKTIAIQVGAISFLDEGVELVLDLFQEKAGVNSLFLATHTFDRGTGGRQLEGHPFPDHGIPEYDRDFQGGNFARTHSEFYRNTFIRDFEAPVQNTGGVDILNEILPATKKRGMTVYCWINENPYAPIARYLPNFALVSEIDPWGRRTGTPCFNHPDYRNWHFSLVEDYIKSYDVDGIAWASERQGPLGNLIGGGWNTRGIGCFCEFCRKKAHARGLDAERTRAAYRALAEYFDAARGGIRPRDGYFVTFWRMLLRYPEILAWEQFWTEGLHDICAEMYGLVKAIDADRKVGWHIMHLNSFSPFYRAEQDYAEWANFSDFIKVVTYHNCAGGRFQRFLKSLHQSIFRDAEPEETYRFLYRILGIEEVQWEDLPRAGFSADYVARETRRALLGVNGKAEIWPGIDIDIPVEQGERNESPQDVAAALVAAFQAGAQGVVLSRKYSEMRLANLAGVNT